MTYVKWNELSPADQNDAKRRYVSHLPWLPIEAYMYPVTKSGRLHKGKGRTLSSERAQHLYNTYIVEQVHNE